MGSLMHKPCLYGDPATAWLMQQSKAALADMLTEILRCESECCDEPATSEAAEARFASVVAARKNLRGLPKRSENRERFHAEGGWNQSAKANP